MDIKSFQMLCQENEDLNFVLEKWEKELDIQETGKGYDVLTEQFGLQRVVCALKERYYREEDLLAQKLTDSNQLKTNKRPVHTIATYYHRLSNGGVQRVVSQLVKLWSTMGYRVILLTDEEPDPNDFPIPETVSRIVIPNCAVIKDGDYSERGSILEEIIQKYQVDVMVYHAYLGNLLFWDLLMFKGNQIPMIVCTHSIFSYFALEGYYRTFVKMPWIYRFCDQLLTLSKVDEAYYSFMGINALYLPNPVEITIPKEEMASLEGHQLIWIGRISREKNPMAAILITKKVLEKIPDVKLLLVGSGDETLSREIKDKIREDHLEQHVELCGFQKDVGNFYLQSSVFLGTSANEGFPCTNVESKLYGVPAVYFELPYVELMKDGRGFQAVPQGDIEGAARETVRLLEDIDFRKQMGKEARESIEQFAAFDYQEAWRTVFDGKIEYPSADKNEKLMMETLLTHWRKGLAAHRETIIRQCRREQKKELEKLRSEYEKREQEIRNSYSYRIGHALMYLPGWVKRIFRRKERRK